jgi:hypothetical protein
MNPENEYFKTLLVKALSVPNGVKHYIRAGTDSFNHI